MPDQPYSSPSGNGSGTSSYDEYMKRARQYRNTGGQTQSDWARAVLGGPAGWYGLAKGERNDAEVEMSSAFGDRAWNDQMNQEVYDSMTPEDWAWFQKQSSAKQLDFIVKRMNEITVRKSQGLNASRGAQAEADKAAQFQNWRMDQMRKLEAFANEMGMSVDELIARGDLGVRRAEATGANQANYAARSAGLGGGGISNMNTQRAAMDAMGRYQMQRSQLGLGARSELMNQMTNMGREAEDMRRYEQGMDLQLQSAQAAANQQLYLQRQQQQAGKFGMLGAVVGGIAGGGNPQAIQAGYQMGSGLGSYKYGQSNPYQPYQYSYPSGSRGGGLGGSKYPYGSQ